MRKEKQMTNAEQFERLFGFTATELWALPEKQFLEWLNGEAPELQIGVQPMTNSEILKRLYKDGDNNE